MDIHEIDCKYLVGDTACQMAGVDFWSYYNPCTLCLVRPTPCQYGEYDEEGNKKRKPPKKIRRK